MAGLNIGKIRLGKEQGKRNVFDLTHDVTTTADWGEVQPLMCREMVPGTDMTVQIDNFVRLNPMPLPVMGRASYRTYHTFVPIQEIWDAFESFMSKTAFNHGDVAYVPKNVPYINQTALTLQVLNMSLCSVYKMSGTSNVVLTLQTTNSNWLTAVNAFKSLGIVSGNIDTTNDFALNAGLTKDVAVTPDGADFTYEITSGSDKYLLCFKLDASKERLRKILIGLGYQLQLMNSSQTTKVSILPMIAFAKAYFDLFQPQRDTTWKLTSTYTLMESIELYNLSDVVGSYIKASNTGTRQKWYNFISELEGAWYTDSTDYYSAHITTPEINSQANAWPIQNVNGSSTVNVVQSPNTQPSLSGVFTQASLNVLKKMYYWANKNTVLGGKVAEYMRVHFGSDVIDDKKSNFIGNNTTNISISDLYNQSETSEGHLGDFAGRGVGAESGNSLHFQSDCYGYWITLCAIVPESTYFQGLDPNLLHTSAEHFFTPAFDAVGYQVTPKQCFVGDSHVESVLSETSYDNSASAGFIPRFSEYKVCQNTLNGDITLGSRRDAMLGYTLDKVVSDNEIVCTPVVGSDGELNGNFDHYQFRANRKDVPAGSPEWRFIGKYDFLQNFNRIFYMDDESAARSYNSRPDQFIIHNILNIKMVAPMLQISDSFETESNDDSIAVQKQ